MRTTPTVLAAALACSALLAGGCAWKSDLEALGQRLDRVQRDSEAEANRNRQAIQAGAESRKRRAAEVDKKLAEIDQSLNSILSSLSNNIRYFEEYSRSIAANKKLIGETEASIQAMETSLGVINNDLAQLESRNDFLRIEMKDLANYKQELTARHALLEQEAARMRQTVEAHLETLRGLVRGMVATSREVLDRENASIQEMERWLEQSARAAPSGPSSP